MSLLSISKDLQICYPLPQDRWAVADLWQDSFNDSPEYIELFFNRVYKPENTLVIKRSGFIISALQMIPYQAKLENKIIPVAYICGACTHPFERGQGLMKKLVNFAKIEMIDRGFIFSIVIPAEPSLFKFYENLGFKNYIFHHTIERVFGQSFIQETKNKCDYTYEECTLKHFPYFDRKQNERRRTILHDEYDFETILQELNCCGDKAFVALKNNIPVGIAFVEIISKKKILIKEIMADNEIVRKNLCNYITNVFDIKFDITHRLPLHTNNYEYGLACNLDGKERRLLSFNMSLMHD